MVFFLRGVARMINSTGTLRFPQSRGVLGDTAAADPFWMLDHSGGIFPGRNEPGLV